MKQKCSNCTYYHGQQNVHCGIHPYGRPDRICPDWKKQPWIKRIEKSLKTLSPKDWTYVILTLYTPAFFCFVLLQKMELLTFASFLSSTSLTYLSMALSHWITGLFVKEEIARLIAIANLLLAITFGCIWILISR
ncbi:MAG: hypothetical protein ACRCYP_03600 [Alphaproteobacteria bacterium]